MDPSSKENGWQYGKHYISIGEWGAFNHVPIFFQDYIPIPCSSFKFNFHWLKDGVFREMVQTKWRHYDSIYITILCVTLVII